MPARHDRDMAAYPLYVQGYDDGWCDADGEHRHDIPLGIVIGVVATCLLLRFAPWAFHTLWH
jgi:hypothetical protein